MIEFEVSLAPMEIWDEEGTTVWIPYHRYPHSNMRSKVRYAAWRGKGLEVGLNEVTDNITDCRVTIEWMREDTDPDRFDQYDSWFVPCTRFTPGAIKFWKVTAE